MSNTLTLSSDSGSIVDFADPAAITIDDHCDPQCPYLKPDNDPGNVLGSCLLLDKDLHWHDYYLAACLG